MEDIIKELERILNNNSKLTYTVERNPKGYKVQIWEGFFPHANFISPDLDHLKRVSLPKLKAKK